MKCYEALWGSQPIDHQISSVLVSDSATIWTGSCDGSIVKWSIKRRTGNIHPVLYLTFHQAKVLQLIYNAPTDVLFSCDSHGVFCCWSVSTGVCLKTRKYDFLSGTISGNFVAAEDGKICGAFHAPDSERNFLLFLADIHSLELSKTIDSPCVFPLVSSEKPPGPCEVLDLFPCFSENEETMKSAIAMTSHGELVWWQTTSTPLSQEDLSGLMLANSLSLDLRLPLTTAAFASKGRYLLLTNSTAWFLLQSCHTHEETGLPVQMQFITSDEPIWISPTQENILPTIKSIKSFGLIKEEQSLRKNISLEKEECKPTDNLKGGLILESLYEGKERRVDSISIVVWSPQGDIKLIEMNQQNLQLSNPRDFHIDQDLLYVKNFQQNCLLQVCQSQDETELILSSVLLQEDHSLDLKECSRGKISDAWRETTEGEKSKVSCIYMITGHQQYPYILAQGLSTGEIVYFTFPWYSIPTSLTDETNCRFLGQSIGHRAPVVICQEAVFGHPSPSTVFPILQSEESQQQKCPILITGALDGSIYFWSLAAQSSGESLFSVHPHITRITHFQSPPSNASVSPWSTCLVSTSEDGLIALTSLQERRIVRLFSGNPPHSQLDISLDFQRGFIASLAQPELQSSTLLVWDLYSGSQDRVFFGTEAEEMMKLFKEDIQQLRNNQTDQPPLPEVLPPHLSFIHNHETGLKLYEGPKPGISILEMDITSLLSGVVNPDSLHGQIVRIVSCLASLHIWGIDSKTDTSVLQMLKETNGLSKASILDTLSLEQDFVSIFRSSLAQGIVFSSNGAMTVGFPTPVLDKEIGELWRMNNDFVAGYLVVMVSLSKQLMHEGFNEVICTSCSSIATMYAIQFLQLMHQCCHPSLAVIVLLWDSPIDILKDTSRVLLASLTDLTQIYTTLEEDKEALNPGDDEFKEIWMLSRDPVNSLSAANLATHQMDILVAGAICCVHCRLVPPSLLNQIVLFLAALSTNSFNSSRPCVLSCLILAEALCGIESLSWFTSLPDVSQYISKLFDTCDQVETMEREKTEDSSSSVAPSPLKRRSKTDVKDLTQASETGEKKRGILHSKSRGRSVRNLRHALQKAKTFQTTEELSSSTENTSHDAEVYKQAMVTLISSLGFIDLRLVLSILSNRFPCSCSWPYSVVAVVKAIGLLLQRRDGAQRIIQELPFLISVLLMSLDPGDQAARKLSTTVTLRLLSEMNGIFPMIDIHQDIAVLAIGNPFNVEQTNSETIAVYSLVNGLKKKSLTLGQVFHQIAAQWASDSSTIPDLRIGALAFRKDGEVLAALCPGVRCLCLWDLRTTWQQKLSSSRSQAPIEPVKIHQIKGPDDVFVLSNDVDLSFSIIWQLSTQVAVMKGSLQLDSVELHLGS